MLLFALIVVHYLPLQVKIKISVICDREYSLHHISRVVCDSNLRSGNISRRHEDVPQKYNHSLL